MECAQISIALSEPARDTVGACMVDLTDAHAARATLTCIIFVIISHVPFLPPVGLRLPLSEAQRPRIAQGMQAGVGVRLQRERVAFHGRHPAWQS